MLASHIIHILPGFHNYKARTLKCLAQGHSHEWPSGTSEARPSRSQFLCFTTESLRNLDWKRRLLKTFCQKEKMLLTSIISISLNVLYLVTLFKPFPNKPWFLCVCSASLLKTLLEKEKLHVNYNEQISPLPTVFSTLFGNFLPFSSNLKLLSANSLSLEESKICCVRKG